MDKNIEQILEDVFSNLHMIKEEEFPNIDLYMDQVTTFLNERFEHSKRFDDDKLLTKTMINNYTKGKLLPPPEKKKYSKDHLIMLTLIYYYKNMLSINDIKSLMSSVSDKYFHSKGNPNLETLYRQLISIEEEKIYYLKDDVTKQLDVSRQSFPDVPPQDKEFLQLLSFICMMSYDIYAKKQIIEKLIDELIVPESESRQDNEESTEKKSDDKNKKEKAKNS